jgi:ankyrin repeat protein
MEPKNSSQTPVRRFGLAGALALTAVLVAGAAAPAGDPPPESNNPPAAPAKPTFDKTGPQVGDQLPDLKLRTLKGEPQHLGDAWHGGPALVVTSSFTCPKSRSRWPELNAIAEKYGQKLNVVIVYVIEAHPVGSVCPYKGIEEVTPENQRDGILRQQPKTLDDRLDLAREFKRYLRIDTPIYVDTMDNQAWKAFGAAPNKAFLVDTNGIVAARQGWFDGKTLTAQIEEFLKTWREARLREKRDNASNDKAAAIDEQLKAVGLDEYKLLDAVRDKNPQELKAILGKIPEAASYIYNDGRARYNSMLMEAVEFRNLQTAEELLRQGADLHARTASCASGLQLAAKIGQPEMVQLLLRFHADPNIPSTGQSPLHEALIAGHPSVAELLVNAAAKEDFFSDVGLGKTEVVRRVLAADPSLAFRPDGASRPPLDYAAANGRLQVAKLLVDSGAPAVDDELSEIDSPLHYAIKSRSLPIVQLLLEHGHSPNTAVGWGGESATSTPPLEMAIRTGDIDIIKLLLRHKANLKQRDTFSHTPLHYAAEAGKVEIVKLLLQAGADPNAMTERFSLPCGSGEEETPQHDTPLHFAAARGNPETIEALVKGGAKVDAPDVHGYTPLMATVEPPIYTGIETKYQLVNVAALLAAGANVNARAKDGATILDIARSQLAATDGYHNGRTNDEHVKAMNDLIALLEKHGAQPGEPKKRAKHSRGADDAE